MAWRQKVHDSLRHNFPPSAPSRQPIYRVGASAASGTLVKNTTLLAQWQQAARAITHVEMELGGVDQAAWAAQIPVLAIRGLSDIVGYKRGLEWTEYACHTAAAFAYALIRSDLLAPPARAKFRWNPEIGDFEFNRVLEKLNKYDASGTHDPQQLREILKDMFNRRAFSATVIIEEPRYFLFALCWAVRLLEHYKQELAVMSGPARVQTIVDELHHLQETTARYIGKGFNLDDHIRRHGESKDRFIDELVTPKLDFTTRALEKRNVLVRQLRTNLADVGLLDSH